MRFLSVVAQPTIGVLLLTFIFTAISIAFALISCSFMLFSFALIIGELQGGIYAFGFLLLAAAFLGLPLPDFYFLKNLYEIKNKAPEIVNIAIVKTIFNSIINLPASMFLRFQSRREYQECPRRLQVHSQFYKQTAGVSQ
jgi:hypothetical protein